MSRVIVPTCSDPRYLQDEGKVNQRDHTASFSEEVAARFNNVKDLFGAFRPKEGSFDGKQQLQQFSARYYRQLFIAAVLWSPQKAAEKGRDEGQVIGMALLLQSLAIGTHLVAHMDSCVSTFLRSNAGQEMVATEFSKKLATVLHRVSGTGVDAGPDVLLSVQDVLSLENADLYERYNFPHHEKLATLKQNNMQSRSAYEQMISGITLPETFRKILARNIQEYLQAHSSVRLEAADEVSKVRNRLVTIFSNLKKGGGKNTAELQDDLDFCFYDTRWNQNPLRLKHPEVDKCPAPTGSALGDAMALFNSGASEEDWVLLPGGAVSEYSKEPLTNFPTSAAQTKRRAFEKKRADEENVVAKGSERDQMLQQNEKKAPLASNPLGWLRKSVKSTFLGDKLMDKVGSAWTKFVEFGKKSGCEHFEGLQEKISKRDVLTGLQEQMEDTVVLDGADLSQLRNLDLLKNLKRQFGDIVARVRNRVLKRQLHAQTKTGLTAAPTQEDLTVFQTLQDMDNSNAHGVSFLPYDDSERAKSVERADAKKAAVKGELSLSSFLAVGKKRDEEDEEALALRVAALEDVDVNTFFRGWSADRILDRVERAFWTHDKSDDLVPIRLENLLEADATDVMMAVSLTKGGKKKSSSSDLPHVLPGVEFTPSATKADAAKHVARHLLRNFLKVVHGLGIGKRFSLTKFLESTSAAAPQNLFKDFCETVERKQGVTSGSTLPGVGVAPLQLLKRFFLVSVLFGESQFRIADPGIKAIGQTVRQQQDEMDREKWLLMMLDTMAQQQERVIALGSLVSRVTSDVAAAAAGGDQTWTCSGTVDGRSGAIGTVENVGLLLSPSFALTTETSIIVSRDFARTTTLSVQKHGASGSGVEYLQLSTLKKDGYDLNFAQLEPDASTNQCVVTLTAVPQGTGLAAKPPVSIVVPPSALLRRGQYVRVLKTGAVKKIMKIVSKPVDDVKKVAPGRFAAHSVQVTDSGDHEDVSYQLSQIAPIIPEREFFVAPEVSLKHGVATGALAITGFAGGMVKNRSQQLQIKSAHDATNLKLDNVLSYGLDLRSLHQRYMSGESSENGETSGPTSMSKQDEEVLDALQSDAITRYLEDENPAQQKDAGQNFSLQSLRQAQAQDLFTELHNRQILEPMRMKFGEHKGGVFGDPENRWDAIKVSMFSSIPAGRGYCTAQTRPLTRGHLDTCAIRLVYLILYLYVIVQLCLCVCV